MKCNKHICCFAFDAFTYNARIRIRYQYNRLEKKQISPINLNNYRTVWKRTSEQKYDSNHNGSNLDIILDHENMEIYT